MTPQDIITSARYILNDTDPSTPRATDTELTGYVNDGLKETLIANKKWFMTVGDFICEPLQCEQTLLDSDALELVEVLCIHGGAALTPFDLSTMNAFNPSWRSDTAGVAQEWSRFPDDPFKFFVYPAAPATAQTLDIRYVRTPAVYALNDSMDDLSPTLQPALVDYVVHRASSKDDEHVLNKRAGDFYQSFLAKVKV
jgi:hypothetical protein